MLPLPSTLDRDAERQMANIENRRPEWDEQDITDTSPNTVGKL